jgi:hypothetical protein
VLTEVFSPRILKPGIITRSESEERVMSSLYGAAVCARLLIAPQTAGALDADVVAVAAR